VLVFGRFELQPERRRLLQDGQPLALGPRAFDVLLALAERRDRIVTKSELMDIVWSGLVVEENNLQVQISALRKLLGSSAIATIPGRGYRFIMAPESDPDGRLAIAGSGAAVRLSPRAGAPAVSNDIDDRFESPLTSPSPKLQDNLPATLTPLLGRAEDLAALRELVDQHRLVSIIGAGGMGKTILAQHLTASRRGSYRHGVCWVELATIANAEGLPAAIGRAIGVDLGDGEPLAGLCNALRPVTMLVALDNAEQVVDGVARVVQAMLDQAPALRFIVTSQAPLKLAAERTYRIGALAVPQGLLPTGQALEFGAVALFTERAQAADARFSLSETNVSAVIDLCRQLDGLPLAIELAASRAPVFGVQRLVASMGDRLRVLTSGRNRLAPARQQTLRAALEWSHGFLDERERVVFRRLAVFAGSASLSMVQQVVPDPAGQGDLDAWGALDALALLVERSLVVAITPNQTVEPRYRLLDTPRVFAWEKLRETAEEAPLRQRHAHVVAATFFEARRVLESGSVRLDAWRHAMAADLDNGREALGWARSADDAVRIVQIATAIARALPDSAYREQMALACEGLALVERIDAAYLQGVLCMIVSAAIGQSQPHHAVILIRRCVMRLPSDSASDTAEVRFARYTSLCVLARSEVRCGELSAAETTLAAVRELVDPTWPPIRQIKLARAESVVAVARGDASAGRRWARQVIALDRAIGESDVEGRINLIDAELAAGDPTSAMAGGVALLAEITGGRNEHALAYCRLLLGAGYLTLGDREQAEVHLRAGWAQAALFDLEDAFANYLALLAALDGRHEAAARLAGYADVSNAHHKREPNEAAAIMRAEQLARAGLGDTIFERLHAEGCMLRGADIKVLAFGSGLGDMIAR
jgi:predicted ATPase